ncbi:MAG TPA: hypothetical protein VGJ26_01825, partial [Pirellulales bacterium]
IHDLSNSVGDVDRTFIVAQTNYNRRLAANQQLNSIKTAFEAETETVSLLDLVEAQRRLADADSRYARSMVEYTLAVKNVMFESGTLLENNGINMAEGPNPQKALADAAKKESLRSRPLRLSYILPNGPTVSRGQFPQQTFGESVQTIAPNGAAPGQPGVPAGEAIPTPTPKTNSTPGPQTPPGILGPPPGNLGPAPENLGPAPGNLGPPANVLPTPGAAPAIMPESGALGPAGGASRAMPPLRTPASASPVAPAVRLAPVPTPMDYGNSGPLVDAGSNLSEGGASGSGGSRSQLTVMNTVPFASGQQASVVGSTSNQSASPIVLQEQGAPSAATPATDACRAAPPLFGPPPLAGGGNVSPASAQTQSMQQAPATKPTVQLPPAPPLNAP